MILDFRIEEELSRGLKEPEALMPGLLTRAVKAGAERFTEMVHEYIEGGHAFTSREGDLEGSISWRPLDGASCEVFANAKHARWVEEGTYPHIIRPKEAKALKIPDPVEGYVLRRLVRHPGSKPYPFMFADMERRRGAVLEAMGNVILEGLMEEG